MVTKLFTAEELLVMPQAKYLDLVRGRLVETPPNGMLHGAVVATLAFLLYQFRVERRTGVVLSRCGYILARNPDTVRGPDLSFVAAERLPARLEEGYLELCPDLAIEVIDPQDRAEDMQRKLLEYLAAGTRLVWVVYPEMKSVLVFRQAGDGRFLRAEDTLDGGDVLLGFTTPVSALFPNP